jgi:hypothetical protein
LIDELTKSFLQKNTLQQCTIAELQQITALHPYFAAAHLLLAKKSAKEDPLLYKKELEKTSLFFQNQMWLKHLLQDNGAAEVITEKKTTVDNLGAVIVEETTNEIPILPKQEAMVTHEVINNEAPLDQPEETPIEMNIPAIKIEPFDPSKAELTFEPYHTVDYFASQGIKIKEEELPKDKFGLQLKSFTEWLKTMKRLPVEAIATLPESNAEKKVEQLAEHSLESREVITEAMAEVWEKQGNNIKASEIYSKLSLLDPSKSAYFATKIEALKKIN